jgi:ketosteroid isomerase-like protein
MTLSRFSIEGGVQDGPHSNDTELQDGSIAALQKGRSTVKAKAMGGPLLMLTLLAGVPSAAIAQNAVVRKAAVAEMLTADRGFNQAMAEHDLNRFLSFVAPDAAFDSAEGRGRDAVATAWAPFFAPDGPTIRWTPTRAESLVAGDVGYTIGTWERRSKDAAGRETVRRGQYLTVWRKQKDGTWMATFDTGSTAR